MKIRFAGATGTVTGSRFLVEHNKVAAFVDCGLFQGTRDIRQKNWTDMGNLSHISGVLLTHAHIDHSGLLPLLPRIGFKGRIFCSPATADLCRVMLPDAGRLQEEDARFLNEKRATHYNPALPLYTEEEAIRVLDLLEPVEDNQWIPFRESFQFRFQRSGHILGSRFVELSEGRNRILFSGDLGPQNSLLLKDSVQITETDYLILESTYGDRVHPPAPRKEQLRDVVNKVIGRGGTLVIPAFAVGRAQEILLLLTQLENEGQIPSVPVHLDSPMALDATDLYMRYEDEIRPEIRAGKVESPLRSLKFRAVRDADESMLLCMDDSPKIVISAAGMLNGGRVLHHLRKKLPDEKNGVLFVGYQVPGSKGALLKNGLRKISIHHQMVDVEAEVFSMESLSAHADSEQLLRWCAGFHKPPLTTFLIHGENPAREALAYRLRLELGWKVVIPKENEEVVFPYASQP